MSYLSKWFNLKQTPQSARIPNTVANSAGGFTFAVDDWTRFDRFLILGTEGPGLDAATLARARPIRIPMAAGFDSLNVATAAGIALYTIARGQGRLGRP